MKKHFLVGAIIISLFSFTGSAIAATGYADAGCGLGSMLFGSEKGFVQVFASTTNGTSGNQTFGITTGTSNCDPAGLVKLDKEREIFAEKNFSTIAKEMAMGEGENLETLAGMYGCSQGSTNAFGTLVQENFSNIVKNEQTSSKEMLSALEAEMAGHKELSSSCAGIIG